MCGRILGLVVVVVLAWTSVVTAQDVAAPSPTRYLFPTTPEVVVKMEKSSNLRYVRGKLLSLTDSEIVLDTGKSSARDRELGDVGQRIGYERIESIRTTDGRLEFRVDEDFQVVSKRIMASYSSVTVEADASLPKISSGLPSAVPGVPAVVATPPARNPPVNGLGNGGFGGLQNLPKTKQSEPTTPANIPNQGMETVENTPPATPAHSATATSGVTEILLCSNCTKEIPASAIRTGVCPHCQIAFSNVSIKANPTSGSQAFSAKPGSAAAPSNAFAPTSNAPAVAPTAANGSQITQSNGFSVDSIPNWAKGGLFVLLVLVGWHMAFNR